MMQHHTSTGLCCHNLVESATYSAMYPMLMSLHQLMSCTMVVSAWPFVRKVCMLSLCAGAAVTVFQHQHFFVLAGF